MLPVNFVSHSCSSSSFVKVKPISKQEKLINTFPVVSSYSSYTPYLSIHFNFDIQKQFWYIRPNDLESVLTHSIQQDSTQSSQIILHLSDIMLHERLNHAISNMLGDEFEDQRYSIIERTTRQLARIMTIVKSNYKCRRKVLGVCVNVTLVIDHICDGRILFASEESSNGMVPASKSSIQLLKKMEVDERDINNECMICLNELGKESDVLCMPCLHIFHGECITKWLGKSHYCPLCRFEMPTELH